MKTSLTIGQYLIQQLHAHGVRHVFGIPGDYVLDFYDQLPKHWFRRVKRRLRRFAGIPASRMDLW